MPIPTWQTGPVPTTAPTIPGCSGSRPRWILPTSSASRSPSSYPAADQLALGTAAGRPSAVRVQQADHDDANHHDKNDGDDTIAVPGLSVAWQFGFGGLNVRV